MFQGNCGKLDNRSSEYWSQLNSEVPLEGGSLHNYSWSIHGPYKQIPSFVRDGRSQQGFQVGLKFWGLAVLLHQPSTFLALQWNTCFFENPSVKVSSQFILNGVKRASVVFPCLKLHSLPFCFSLVERSSTRKHFSEYCNLQLPFSAVSSHQHAGKLKFYLFILFILPLLLSV